MVASAVTYLLLWDRCVVVDVQGSEEVRGALLQPHEQVTRWHSLLKAHQFNVKDQHSAAWHASGCRKESLKKTTQF